MASYTTPAGSSPFSRALRKAARNCFCFAVKALVPGLAAGLAIIVRCLVVAIYPDYHGLRGIAVNTAPGEPDRAVHPRAAGTGPSATGSSAAGTPLGEAPGEAGRSGTAGA
jgi:hypothetical protein